MGEGSRANTFLYQDARIFDDSFHGFEEVLQNSSSSPQGIRFEFHHPLESLHRLKSLILKYKEVSNWDNLYFFNTSDFVNIVLEKEVYLPKNVNLFINESCFIGCNFCENPNDIKTYLKLKDIKSFLKLYSIGDDINFNILGQGDPLFNPELFDILEYIHSLGAHITFFSGGKSLLYTDKMEELFSYVDEFKINLSCFSYESYNATHRTPIREEDFPRLLERLKYIGEKTTLICVLVRENIGGIMEFYKLAQELDCRGVEFKKNLQYLTNDVLDVPKIFEKVSHVLDLLYQGSKMDFVSNIGTGKIRVEYRDFFHKSSSLLERYVEVPEKSLDEINAIDVCHQFGNSLDITENKRLSLCCHYKEGDVSDLLFDEKYYENILYQNKKQQYKTQTPQSCRKCPMPVDRYKNFLKYEFVHNL